MPVRLVGKRRLGLKAGILKIVDSVKSLKQGPAEEVTIVLQRLGKQNPGLMAKLLSEKR